MIKDNEVTTGNNMKIVIKKWHLLLMAGIMVITTLGFSVTAVMAAQPPPTPSTTGFTIWQDYGTTYKGTQGTYMDIIPEGGQALPGWCVDQTNYITIGAHYTAQIFNYFFGNNWYPDYITDLTALHPKITANINWFAIAYILNHEVPGATMWEIQEAIWTFTPGGYLGNEGPAVDSNTTAMINAANNYLSTHNGIYVPGPGELTPVIYYVQESVQLIFFQLRIPGTPPAPTPELPTIALLGIGLVGLGGFGWLQRKRYVSRQSAIRNN
jgi:hypothetical protein